jgi:ABC-type taurine transport system ATPase subunit
VTNLAIDHVGKTYADGTEALRDIQVHAAEGEIVAILGGSGCGKTTLLRLVAGLDTPSTGAISVGGQKIAGTHPAISAVFQEPRLLPWLKVGANIAFGGQRLDATERARRASALIERIGLSGYDNRWPRDLSGGQSQRVAIARALIGHPGVLLLVALLSLLQATLTLPGMAAIALTLGMAIDANVLINERVREELRNGAPPQAAIAAGYERAWGTILDSNVTTLIAGLALLAFGSGPVKGFAVVHCLGILTSMFSAVFFSRGLVNLWYGRRRKLNGVSIGQLWKPGT